MKKALFIFIFLGLAVIGAPDVFASHPSGNSNIDFTEPNHWAWNDVIRWIDFCDVVPGGGDCVLPVLVGNTKISGYASSSVGFIELDCATTPEVPINICGGGAGNWFVSNDGQGGLAGYAWNDAVGWISFCGNGNGGSEYVNTTWVCPGQPGHTDPAPPTYQVTLISPSPANPNMSEFLGYAWNDVVGWISFNCQSGTNGCSPPLGVDYKVLTEWTPVPPTLPTASLTSSTFDTCATSIAPNCGAAPNSIVWQAATIPAGNPSTYIQFQLASSNAIAGPWADANFVGPDNTTTTFYSASNFTNIPAGLVSDSVPINQANHVNQRYFRYRIYLNPCNPGNPPTNPNCFAAPESPVVTDVILNWSP